MLSYVRFGGLLMLPAIVACSDPENKASQDAAASASSVLTDFASVTLPYRADTLLMKRMEKPLPWATAVQLFRHLTEAEEYAGGHYYLNRCLYLDSLYRAVPNPAFDIGELVKAKAYALDQWKVSEQAIAVTVLIDFQSYEADPYTAGQAVVLITATPEGKPLYSLLIGERSSGGDPPFFGSTLQTALVEASQEIRIRQTNESGEYVEDGNANMTRSVKEKIYRIRPDGSIIKVSDKELSQENFR